MLDAVELDGVVVSTADHTHAVIGLLAMERGKHLYCEKPMTWSVDEARRMTELARTRKLVTQMGTQIHSNDPYRRTVELVRAGAIGDVTEVHVWVGRTWVGSDRPKDTPPVPKGLHWNLWLGPAPERPYHPSYHPASWRGWWDFGGGTLSDMACHHMDLPFWALDLDHPTTIEAKSVEKVHPESAPRTLEVTYAFPAKGGRSPVTLTWYQGGPRPRQFKEAGLPDWGDGTLFVGTKGMILADYDRNALVPEKDFADYRRPEPSIPRSIGHHKEWTEAIKGNGTTTCRFDYAGPLTETVLLGNVAFRAGEKLAWDAAKLTTGSARGDSYIRRIDRRGW
jgi:predicted dehydrogenase